jgi:hypothetical protein
MYFYFYVFRLIWVVVGAGLILSYRTVEGRKRIEEDGEMWEEKNQGSFGKGSRG